ncbi:MAG: hypothetical protein ACREDR_00260 [Blastocatellia bacterium]
MPVVNAPIDCVHLVAGREMVELALEPPGGRQSVCGRMAGVGNLDPDRQIRTRHPAHRPEEKARDAFPVLLDRDPDDLPEALLEPLAGDGGVGVTVVHIGCLMES